MRRLTAMIDKSAISRVHRTVDFERLAVEWSPELRFLVLTRTEQERKQVQKMQSSGLSNVSWAASESLQPADIVVPRAQSDQVTVLYRESDTHHGLLLTNRCNSYCLMCSQPPIASDDSWLIDEALDVIQHIRYSPLVFGLSGGEPLLLGWQLRRIIDAMHLAHPKTRIEVLTNGRLFGDSSIVEEVLHGLPANIHWLVPLYGHADYFHDFVVQSHGAFEQTLGGLLALQENQQAVQLRIVLIEPVLQILEELCAFIGRNLPFVREVALMACEPIGFALANRDLCEVDLGDWEKTLLGASRILNRHAVPHLIMNAPLCALPRPLWPLAHRSISDWKNSYVSECVRCAVKDECAGLFAWHERGWKPTKIRAIEGASA